MHEQLLETKLLMLTGKDTSQAFETLKELEKLSEETDILYPYTKDFIEMIHSEKYVIRVRGFRLFCRQSKWDNKGLIDENIEKVLSILYDEKPTAVRQALAALKYLARYKKNLNDYIRQKTDAIDVYQYKDTMHSLINKDRDELYEEMEKYT